MRAVVICAARVCLGDHIHADPAKTMGIRVIINEYSLPNNKHITNKNEIKHHDGFHKSRRQGCAIRIWYSNIRRKKYTQ
jgi:hypothetical protein